MQKNKIIIGVLLVSLLGVGAFFINEQKNQDVSERQQMIHEQGMNVMPFDLDKTEHIFKKTETGGTQSVIVRNASDIEDLSLVRMHIQMEAQKFSQGNFSDPVGLHGESMPGLAVLDLNFSKMKVTYSEIENGAKIDFETTDSETINAIHSWFDAQVSDHGKDASAE